MAGSDEVYRQEAAPPREAARVFGRRLVAVAGNRTGKRPLRGCVRDLQGLAR
jgi:hypothetical protein